MLKRLAITGSVLLLVTAILLGLNLLHFITAKHLMLEMREFAREHERLPDSPEEFVAWYEQERDEASGLEAYLDRFEFAWGTPVDEVREGDQLVKVRHWTLSGREEALASMLTRQLLGLPTTSTSNADSRSDERAR